jgi:hypothetical protein
VPSSSKCSFLSDLPLKPMYAFLLPRICHTPSPSHPPRLDFSDDRSVQITDHINIQFSPATCYFLLLRPYCLPQQRFVTIKQ